MDVEIGIRNDWKYFNMDVEQRTVNQDWRQQVIFSTETCHVTLLRGIGPDMQIVVIQ